MPLFRITIKGKDEPEVYEGEEAIEFVKQKLDEKYSKLKEFAAKAWGELSPFDKAALATAPIPVVGDIAGLVADADMFINDPESRTLLNAGLSAMGLIPFVPALSTIGKVAKSTDDLPMDEASRMARAEDMGFDASKITHHGSASTFEEFDVGKGAYFSPDESMASQFGDTKQYLLRRGENAFNVSYHGELSAAQVDVLDGIERDLFDEEMIDAIKDDFPEYEGLADAFAYGDVYRVLGRSKQNEVIAALKEKGYTSVTSPDFHGDASDMATVIFNPEDIRSIDASFDPMKKLSPNIMASGAASVVGANMLMKDEDDLQ